MFIEVLFTLSNNWKPSEHYIHNQILQINKKKGMNYGCMQHELISKTPC